MEFDKLMISSKFSPEIDDIIVLDPIYSFSGYDTFIKSGLSKLFLSLMVEFLALKYWLF